MTATDYYILHTLSFVTFVLLAVPPIIKFMLLIEEGEQEVKAARQRIAARHANRDSLPGPGRDI